MMELQSVSKILRKIESCLSLGSDKYSCEIFDNFVQGLRLSLIC